MVKRRAGQLLSIEIDILEVALQRKVQGADTFHGFAAAKLIRDSSGARRLTAQGTLYKALARLERAGLLTSEWEDPDLAAAESRPRRRLYRMTDQGQRVIAMVRAERPLPSAVIRRMALE